MPLRLGELSAIIQKPGTNRAQGWNNVMQGLGMFKSGMENRRAHVEGQRQALEQEQQGRTQQAETQRSHEATEGLNKRKQDQLERAYNIKRRKEGFDKMIAATTAGDERGAAAIGGEYGIFYDPGSDAFNEEALKTLEDFKKAEVDAEADKPEPTEAENMANALGDVIAAGQLPQGTHAAVMTGEAPDVPGPNAGQIQNVQQQLGGQLANAGLPQQAQVGPSPVGPMVAPQMAASSAAPIQQARASQQQMQPPPQQGPSPQAQAMQLGMGAPPGMGPTAVNIGGNWVDPRGEFLRKQQKEIGGAQKFFRGMAADLHPDDAQIYEVFADNMAELAAPYADPATGKTGVQELIKEVAGDNNKAIIERMLKRDGHEAAKQVAGVSGGAQLSQRHRSFDSGNKHVHEVLADTKYYDKLGAITSLDKVRKLIASDSTTAQTAARAQLNRSINHEKGVSTDRDFGRTIGEQNIYNRLLDWGERTFGQGGLSKATREDVLGGLAEVEDSLRREYLGVFDKAVNAADSQIDRDEVEEFDRYGRGAESALKKSIYTDTAGPLFQWIDPKKRKQVPRAWGGTSRNKKQRLEYTPKQQAAYLRLTGGTE